MEVIKTKLKKIIAGEGKLIVSKTKNFNEEGNEIPRDGAKVIYLAINDNEENYEEIEESEV